MKTFVRILFSSFFILFLLGAAQAQGTSSKQKSQKKDPHYGLTEPEDWKQVKIGDDLFNQHSYYNAIDVYLPVHERNPENLYVAYKLALTYYTARDFKNAEKYFRVSTKLEDKKVPEDPMSFFYFGESLKMNQKYDEAKSAFGKFYRIKIKTPEIQRWKKIARNEFRSCDFAKKMIQGDTSFTEVKFLEGDVNHAYTDFSPIPKGEDTLVFASLRQDSVISYGYDDEVFFPVNLFQSVREGETWGTPKAIPGKINNPYEHSANPVFTKDGSKMYFSRCYQDRHNQVMCRLYQAEKEGNGWSTPEKLPSKINVHGYTTTQPTLGYMTKRKRRQKVELMILYYVSDRPGGIGGKDIWFTEIDESGNFSAPENCGKRVNTLWDEVTPHYDTENKTMYFSSNYHFGIGGLDIFKVRGYNKRFTKAVNMGIPVNSSYDDTYYNPYGDTLTEKNGFLVSNRPGGIALTSETCCDDIYQFKDYVPPMCQLVGYLKLQEITEIKEVQDTSVTASIDTVITQAAPKYDTLLNFTPIAEARYGYVKQRHVDAVVEELGKADLKGFKDWVTWVDTTDAEGKFTMDLVIGKHYSLVFTGDSLEDQIINADEWMAKCPNVEEFVVGILPPPVEVPDSIAQKDSLDLIASTQDIEHREKLSLDIDTEDLKENDKFVLDDMFFEFDKDVVKESSLPAVELLLMFMESHPTIKIEISGHTDSKGNDAYNEDLSNRRAKRVRQMLIDEGINKKRLVAVGYGEKEPRAPNTNSDGSDNPKGRALNRRTEIKILSKDFRKKN